MNRREMLTAGFRRLARILPGLAAGRSLDLLAGGRETPPRPEVLSFPPKRPAPANPAHQPAKED